MSSACTDEEIKKQIRRRNLASILKVKNEINNRKCGIQYNNSNRKYYQEILGF